MLEELLLFPSAQQFLLGLPRDQWAVSVQACALYGMQVIRKQFQFALTADQLCALAGITKQPVKFSSARSKPAKSRKAARGHHVPKPKHAGLPKSARRTPVLKRPPVIQEPNTCSLENAFARHLASMSPETYRSPRTNHASPALQIAEEFLQNPFTSHLAGTQSQSASYLKILSPEVYTSLKLFEGDKASKLRVQQV